MEDSGEDTGEGAQGQQGGCTEDSGVDSTEDSREDSGGQGMCAPSSPHPCL